MMKLIIEVPDQYIPILSKWASVSRTLNEAKRMCANLATVSTDEALQEAANHCWEELHALNTPLDTLHDIVRSEIWRANADRSGL